MTWAGRFVTFEGIDGAGKSSHLEAATTWLQSQGVVVHGTREPGGTALAEQLREAVLHQPMDALTESLLVFAARRDHLVQRIEPALARGELVLCDRFTDATFAYQGGGRGQSMEVLSQLERWVHGHRQPDLTLWFDLPAAEAAARRAAARAPDRFERQDEGFFERVRQGYLARLNADPHRFVRIEATGSLGEVRQRVLDALAAQPW